MVPSAHPGGFVQHRFWSLLVVAAMTLAARVAVAQDQWPPIDPMTGQPYPIDPVTGQPIYSTSTPTPPTTPTTTPVSPLSGAADNVFSGYGTSTLVCAGDWRFPLTETRQEIGPARFARQRDLQRDLALAGSALAYCTRLSMSEFAEAPDSAGPCYGLLIASDKIDFTASALFGDEESVACLTRPPRSGGDCEADRNLLTTLRSYDKITVDRAELVLSYEVCASPERKTNYALRTACETLETAVLAEVSEDGRPGQFSLFAPLPATVALPITTIRELTDGRYLGTMFDNAPLIRKSFCNLDDKKVSADEWPILDRDWFVSGKADDFWNAKAGGVRWGMCNELSIAHRAAETCRAASVYIDERGELHLNSSLTSRKERKNATLCIDVSDFHPDQPLMITVGLDSTGSVPERVWPGESMHIGTLIDEPVTAEDVLHLHVYGKAHGVSLAEVLRINGVTDLTTYKDDACRMARSWLPVVDHEVPIGDPEKQAVIPIDFGRGRVGDTQRIDSGDTVLLWVSHIEPSGAVLAEYSSGQAVGYHPPPLVGEPTIDAGVNPETGGAAPPSVMMDLDGDGVPETEVPYDDVLMQPGTGPNTSLAMRTAGVDQPLLPRRARYPGSRVLRLGTPEGNHEYPLRVCTLLGKPGFAEKGASACASAGGTIIVEEKLFVHGEYHFGLRVYFGYSSFPTPEYEARPLGGNSFEVVETAGQSVEYDLAVLLAAYPFGRDPRRFSYKPWSWDYWKGAAVLAGFGLRKATEPWEDFYAGASLPVANGVSLTGMAHIGLREVPIGVRAGDTFTSMDSFPDVDALYPMENAVVVGASVGLSFDYDLFERAFTNVVQRFRGRYSFTSSGSASARRYNR